MRKSYEKLYESAQWCADRASSWAEKVRELASANEAALAQHKLSELARLANNAAKRAKEAVESLPSSPTLKVARSKKATAAASAKIAHKLFDKAEALLN